MKKFAALFALASVLLLNAACEQQSWEQTKMFNQKLHKDGEHGAGDQHPANTEGAPRPAAPAPQGQGHDAAKH